METESAIRSVTLIGLGEIPEVGGIVSGMIAIFWPESKEDVWGQIKDKVESLINQKLSDFEYQQVSESLEGLRNVLADYDLALADGQGDEAYITAKYTAALSHFESNLPHFQSKGYEVLLLPLFAQFANLHLALLRDGITFGARWGWPSQVITDEESKIKQSISAYSKWASEWYDQGYKQLKLPSDSTYRVESWNVQNNYTREMTINVLDSMHFWPYFDPQVNPGDTSIVTIPTRTVYSQTVGVADDTGITIPEPPTLPITGIQVWGWNYIDAVQVQYGGEWGPRQGDQQTPTFGGSNVPPHGWNGPVDVQTNPVIRVSGRSGELPELIKLWFEDGSVTNDCAGIAGRGGLFDFVYDGHVLSSIHVMGTSRFYRSANCIVFGWRLAHSY